jgi:hypothetical protein
VTVLSYLPTSDAFPLLHLHINDGMPLALLKKHLLECTMPDSEFEVLKQEILHYLLKRPDASDDLEGITRFWVMRQRIEVAAATVERALDSLVESGILIKDVRRSPSGKTQDVRYELASRSTGKS